MLRGYINVVVCQAFPYYTPPPSLSKEVYLFFVASVDIYISQASYKLDLSSSCQGSIKLVLCPTPPHPPHPHPHPLPSSSLREMYEEGCRSVTRTYAPHCTNKKSTSPWKYLSILRKHRSILSQKFNGICDSCLNGLSDHVLGPFRGQTPLCLANISVTTSVYKVQHEAAEVVST